MENNLRILAQQQLKAGKNKQAKRLLTSHLRKNPNDEKAWLILSTCVNHSSQKAYCFKQLLRIEPSNSYAKEALDKLKLTKSASINKSRLLVYSSSIPILSLLLFLLFVVTNFMLIPQISSFINLNNHQAVLESGSSNSEPDITLSSTLVTQYLTEETPVPISTVIPLPNIPSAYCISANVSRSIGEIVNVRNDFQLEIEVDGRIREIDYLGLDFSSLNEDQLALVEAANKNLIGQSVILVEDTLLEDTTETNLRYVFTNDSFLNFEFLENGLALASDSANELSCMGFFMAAESNAQNEELGIWEIVDTRLDPNDWRNWPVIPYVSQYARDIYLSGIEDGADPLHFSVVGDCQSLPYRFLSRFDWPDYELPEEFAYLQSTREHFSGSFSRWFATVADSNTVASVFSIYWTDPNICRTGETPIDCEFRSNNPSIVLISLGTNWVGTVEDYEYYLRQIVEYSLERNVLPIIATKPDPYSANFPLNRAMAQVAYDYDIPLWNFWLAVQPLPNHGMNPTDPLGIHFTWDAYPVKRLTGLQILDSVLHSINDEPTETDSSLD